MILITLLFLSVLLGFHWAYYIIIGDRPVRGIPVVGMEKGEWSSRPALLRFMKPGGTGKAMILEGLEKYAGRAFQLFTMWGPTIILHPKFLDDTKDNPKLSGAMFLEKYFPDHLGFWAYKQATFHEYLMNTYIIRTGISRSLSLLTRAISNEAAKACDRVFPTAKDGMWNRTVLFRDMDMFICRVISILIFGEADNEEWISIAKTHVTNCTQAGRELLMFPPVLRPIAYWFLPTTRKVRQQYFQVKRLVEERTRKNDVLNLGKQDSSQSLGSCLVWAQQYAEQSGEPDKFDIVHSQLYFMAIAIHTVSSLLTSIVMDLLYHPEFIDVLRTEIHSTIGSIENIHNKSQLHQMKIMDSFMKESQRLSGTNFLINKRGVAEDLTLSDGTVLPKGAIIGIPALVPDSQEGDEFDGYRYVRRIETSDKPSHWKFTNNGNDMPWFGVGRHECPGRFFGEVMIKVSLIHFLEKYEWKFEDDANPPRKYKFAHETIPDPKGVLLYKTRGC